MKRYMEYKRYLAKLGTDGFSLALFGTKVSDSKKFCNKYKEKIMTPRNFHKLAIIKKEARGDTRSIPSKKLYSRKLKHRKKDV